MQVEGRVVPQISVAPESLVLGEVSQDEQVAKNVLVRGKKPFKILTIKSDSDSFDFKTDNEASERHVVNVAFNAKQSPGNLKETIHIATDMDSGLQTTFTVYATVVPPTKGPMQESSNIASAAASNDQSARSSSKSPQQIVRH